MIIPVEMKVAPFRALTHDMINSGQYIIDVSVEMKVAPFRALTQNATNSFAPDTNGRNEGRPFQGIDTILFCTTCVYSLKVEMKVVPFRALTL